MVLPLLFGALAKAGSAIAASSLTAPLLSLAGTAIGAAADRSARKTADYNNSPQGIRANAEAAGFNPLLFVGPGTGTGAQFAPTMGHTIASGFAAAADQITELDRLRMQRQQLEQENARLTRMTQRQTLQPTVPGIYGDRTRQTQAPQPGASSTRQYAGPNPPRFPGLPGVAPQPPTFGTIPYTSASGHTYPGPNAENQMGIDEVLGWLAMETPGFLRSALTPPHMRHNRPSFRNSNLSRVFAPMRNFQENFNINGD